MSEKKQLGKILLRQRALSPEELDRALAENKGGRLASRLAASGAITDVAEYRVRLPKTDALQEIAIDLEPAPHARAEELARTVEARLESALNLRVPVQLVAPGSLPRFEMKSKRWVQS